MAITISVSPGSVAEGNGNLRPLSFLVSLSGPSASAVKVDYLSLHGTALDDADFSPTESPVTLTFQPGETSKIVNIGVRGDLLDETDENFTLQLFNPQGATLDGDVPVLQGNGVILDDDGSGANLALFVSNPILVEGNSGTKVAQFTVSLSQPSTSTITLPYTTADGTATAGEDYAATHGTLTFAPGQTTAVVNVPVNGDTKVEASETFSLVVTPSAAIASGTAASTGQALILDDDAGGTAQPTLSVRGGSLIEGAGNHRALHFVVSLSAPSTSKVTADYHIVNGTALDDVDFSPAENPVTITFQPGQTSEVINVGVPGDLLDETDENFTLELFNPHGAALADDAPALRANGVILDDDGPGSNRALFVSNPILLEGNSGTKLAQFTVSLSEPSSATISLPYTTVDGTATAGQDYTAMSGILTFAPGQTTAAVSVPVLGDTTVEPSETFSLVVTPNAAIASGTAGATGQALILDDDAGGTAEPTLSLRGAKLPEGTGNLRALQFVASLSAPSTSKVTAEYRTVDGTAQAGVDYGTTIGKVTFAAGETSKIINVGVRGDTLVEPDETFSLQLFNASGAAFAGGGLTLSATGIILNDDGPPCFAAGTRILTDRGEVPIEQLREGDRVVAVDAPGARRALPIDWIGHRRVDCSRHPEPRKVYPVRVRKDAFAPGTPSRDVWLSPDHAVYADDVLIPVKHLVNGRTVTREQRAEITYYHVELAEHAVLLAEGLPAESLVPGSDRSRFANGGARLRLHPDFDALAWEADGCAPLVVTGPTLEAVRQRLDQRADIPCSPAAAVANG